MLYLKHFIIYSLLGFSFESFVFKIFKINKHSGVLIGPYTLVYGIGGMICSYIYNYVKIINNTTLNTITCYIVFVITCTIIELIIGYLIKLIYKFDSWDYSYRKYHLGKYISLDFALVWGILSLFFIKYLNTFCFQITLLIPNNFTLILLAVIILDILLTFYKTKK